VGSHDTFRFSGVAPEVLRSIYTARFGPLLETGIEPGLGVAVPELGADDEAAVLFRELTFASLTEADPRYVVASAGAMSRAGHEVFLAAAAPFGGFAGVLEWLVRDHAPLLPGTVIPTKLWLCPFDAVLLAPSEAGSIPLGEVGGAPRLALNVVPLTPAETELAACSIDRLVAALRSAGALFVADPMRDCVLRPEETRRFWRLARPLLLDDTLDRLAQRSKRLDESRGLRALEMSTFVLEIAERLVREAKLLVRHIEARRVELPARRRAAQFHARAAALAEIEGHVMELFERGLVPGALREKCLQLVSIVLASHPGVEQLLLEAQERSSRVSFDVEELLSRLVSLLREARPELPPEALLAAGRAGYARAEKKAATADGFIPRDAAWQYIVAGMLTDRSTDEEKAAARAMVEGVGAFSAALRREPDRPPIERLEDALTVSLLRMAEAWCGQLGLETPWEGQIDRPPKPSPAKPTKTGTPPSYH
jgi:hypothetical protein